MSEWQLLIILVPNELKDDVVDTLIELDGISGFNLEKISGYSREHSQFNLREQVEGNRQMYRFEVMHRQGQMQHLLSALGPVCAAPQLRYWILPVLEQGHFGDYEEWDS